LAGALLSDGVELDDVYRQAADCIYPIAGGTKPADPPIEQPTGFELSVNVRVARDLGITLTPTILACADEVIE
jgi:putative ABC transport system substrate-binding protein